MKYLKNAWYAAAWADELSQRPLARMICETPIVLFHDTERRPVALFDACPHRFAPLSLGRVQGDRIACGYHGLEFGRDGRCIKNPHGNGATPAALSVRSFPVVERCGMVWIWMGRSEMADSKHLPEHLKAFDQPGFVWSHGNLNVAAPYEMVVDNLLDLSHVEYLHPFLGSAGNSKGRTMRVEHDGNLLICRTEATDTPVTPLFRLMREGDESVDDENGDLRGETHWLAPANIYLDTTTTRVGAPLNTAISVPTYHLLTPATADSTHYFWAAGWNRLTDRDDVAQMLRTGIVNAFENEDEPMIRACRSRMHSNDLLENRPALLPIDEASVLARRILGRLIDVESKENAVLPDLG
jgi:phenylpropionate dioxygenase-like ring-hydroxylating dioxygenase large terminal subunit